MFWLHDGWKEFSEHHSISCGFFLVFNYEGNSKFNVLIFDLSASEIQYPGHNVTISVKPDCGKKHSVPKKRGIEVDESGPSEDNFFCQRLNRWRSSNRRNRSLLPNLFELAPEFSMRINKHKILPRNKRFKMEDPGENVPMSCEGKQRAREIRNSRGSMMDELGKDKRNRNEKLLSSDAANKGIDSSGKQLKVKQDEDAELLGVNKSSKNATMQSFITQEREKMGDSSKMFEPENPFFKVTLKLYNVHNSFCLGVPAEFSRNYLNRVKNFVKLEVSHGRQWKVGFVRVSGGRVMLSKGWSTFVRENHLLKGDVCVFELIQIKDIVLKVTILSRH
ncbi:B3 domain-containing transcription factor [Actinidia chinensis var. chinensis]|uniref:B3 domain-containing transcription factor n=1 Tax=Actinidia chinensis var. chinensis TaxID=1590841 RepID=A0A2R6RBX9_ACTCC|nr:B3 domain-containing transcription factor [Actinidia chinensis var. chinensis]